ncbi:hypothetical protein AQJ11_34060 [Streptomyces corchorusii]|uniref:Uncharacterized protein n=1 Tax=Streptomyces corchorusii TaxID=1903 RepID=A0A101PVK0_STRCK|nr:hypothetical protein AQJ11_34060 [Streptomyces corchorusii]
MQVTIEAITDAVTGSLASPRTVLLGATTLRGRLQYTGRGTTLSQTFGYALADVLALPTGAHPWEGWKFSAGGGAQHVPEVALVEPEMALKVAVGTARSGSWGSSTAGSPRRSGGRRSGAGVRRCGRLRWIG